MSSPPPWIAAAYVAERGRALGEAAERLAEALQAGAALDLARALEPGAWGRVREAMEVLRSSPRAGLPALPSLAAWLTLAPRKKGVLRFLLTGWEDHALSEGWSSAGALQEALYSWAESLPPGPELNAARLIIELLEEALTTTALAAFAAQPTSQVHRGLVAFFRSSRARLPEICAALMDFSTRPTPEGMDAGLSYAGGEAITAWKGLQERLRRSTPPAPVPTPTPAESWAGRRAELRERAVRDLPAAQELARRWLEGGLPPTAAGEALRQEAQRVLALALPLPAPALMTPAPPTAVSLPSASAAPTRATLRLVELIRGEEPVALRVEALGALCRRAEREPAAAMLAEELLLECTFAAELTLRLRAAQLLGVLH